MPWPLQPGRATVKAGVRGQQHRDLLARLTSPHRLLGHGVGHHRSEMPQRLVPQLAHSVGYAQAHRRDLSRQYGRRQEIGPPCRRIPPSCASLRSVDSSVISIGVLIGTPNLPPSADPGTPMLINGPPLIRGVSTPPLGRLTFSPSLCLYPVLEGLGLMPSRPPKTVGSPSGWSDRRESPGSPVFPLLTSLKKKEKKVCIM